MSSERPDLTPAQFKKVRENFDACLDLPSDQWEECVERLCGDDPRVARATIELLLGTIRPATGFDPERGGLLASISAPGDPEAAAHPKHIGPFTIQRLIGRGGMGVVYLATQSNPNREVALKVLRDGPIASSMRGRFAREVSVLGRLEHPGIARLYEAGSEPGPGGGIAYFSMEYVRGERINDFAATKSLNTAARLELMAKVADAVQHAHAQGVIHRDLKPANILVTDASRSSSDSTSTKAFDGQPKVLDFGVARLLDSDSQITAITEPGLIVGTIAYMSPEQLAGDHLAVDTRADVYAMGVILYELLTGRLPHQVENKSISEAARMVRDDDPPSLVTLTPASGVGKLDSDLAAIVAMAMSKEKERRYATAAAFGDDLRRYLQSEPIQARLPTASYRLSRFVRRYRPLVIGASVLGLVLICGFVTSTVMYVREQQARRLAASEAALSSAVRDYMIEGLLMSAAPERMGYDVKMLDVLTHAAEGLHERFADYPEVEAQVRSDLARVLAKLGRFRESLEQSRQEILLLDKLVGPDHPRSVVAQLNVATMLGQLHEPEQALEAAASAFAHAQRAYSITDADILSSYSEYGGALSRANKHDQAIDILQQGLKLAAKFPETDQVAAGSTLGLLNWLVAAKKANGQKEGVLDLTRQIADRVFKLRGAAHEETLATQSNLVAELTNAGQNQEAAELASTLPDRAQKTFPPGHPGRGYCAITATAALTKVGRYEEAERCGQQAYGAFCAAFDEYNWAADRSMRLIRQNYALWPGHAAELQQWTNRQARLHLMTTKASELEGTIKTLRKMGTELASAGASLPVEQILDHVWADRNQLAPPGHPRRAVFFAALAAIYRKLDIPQHVQEGIDIAQESLVNAEDRSIAEGLIAAAKSSK